MNKTSRYWINENLITIDKLYIFAMFYISVLTCLIFENIALLCGRIKTAAKILSINNMTFLQNLAWERDELIIKMHFLYVPISVQEKTVSSNFYVVCLSFCWA